MIAVGGTYSLVYILSPSDGALTHKIRPTKAVGTINCVKFVFPKHPELLFIAMSLKNGSNSLTGWRVQRTKLQAQKLIELVDLDAPPIRILIPNLHDPKFLFCATEKCIKAWNIENAAQDWLMIFLRIIRDHFIFDISNYLKPNKSVRERRSALVSVVHPNLPFESPVDSLVQFDSDHVISKVSSSGAIFLWKPEQGKPV